MISLLPSKKLAYYLYVKALVPYLVISKLYHLSVGEATLCEVMVIVYVIDKDTRRMVPSRACEPAM